jgi:hypothetical protein
MAPELLRRVLVLQAREAAHLAVAIPAQGDGVRRRLAGLRRTLAAAVGEDAAREVDEVASVIPEGLHRELPPSVIPPNPPTPSASTASPLRGDQATELLLQLVMERRPN